MVTFVALAFVTLAVPASTTAALTPLVAVTFSALTALAAVMLLSAVMLLLEWMKKFQCLKLQLKRV